MKKLNKKQKIIRNLIIACISIIIILLIALNINRSGETKKSIPAEMTSIEEILTYYQCTNIKIVDSKEEEFKTDIYLTFGEDLWIDGKSNEAYYQGIILYISNLLDYQKYRMIDSSRELLIAVIGNGQKVENIYINGEVNYFAKEQTKQMIGQYEKTKTTNMSIQSNEIQKLIQNEWQAGSISFGTVESRFYEYDIYFDEGIEVKTLGGKVYNIIFTEKYKKNIVNNLKVEDTIEKIEETLGKPNFEGENVIGYKGEKVYVFFSENQVSVYRREDNYENEKFLELWNEFQETKEAKEFVNGLTDIWNDYNMYQYDTNYIFLEYALRGIQIQFNVSSENGIILYNNYEGKIGDNLTLDNLNVEDLPNHVYLHINDDLVFAKEEERISMQQRYYVEEYRNMVNENYFLEEEYQETYRFTDRKSSQFYLIYQYVPNEGIREVKFVSINREYPNSELIRHKQIYTYGWLNDEQFVYSVKQEGIFYYNAKTRVLRTLVSGNENFEIKKVESDTLFYDETSIKLK